MRILLDECVPWPVRHCLVGHQCTTVQQQGWGGWKNGDLIRRAEAKFDLFITSDQNMQYQQNLAGGKSPSSNFPPTTCGDSNRRRTFCGRRWMPSPPVSSGIWKCRDD